MSQRGNSRFQINRSSRTEHDLLTGFDPENLVSIGYYVYYYGFK